MESQIQQQQDINKSITDCVEGMSSKVDNMTNEFDSLKAMMKNLIYSQQE